MEKFTRIQAKKELEKIKNNLEKKGLDWSLVSEGKTIDQLAYNSKTFQRAKNRVKVAKERPKVLKEVEKIKSRQNNKYQILANKFNLKINLPKNPNKVGYTNFNGVSLTLGDLELINALNKKFKQKKDKLISQYEGLNGKLNENELKFLNGVSFQGKNSSQLLTFQGMLHDGDLIEYIDSNENIKAYLNLFTEKIDSMNLKGLEFENTKLFEELKEQLDIGNINDMDKKSIIKRFNDLDVIRQQDVVNNLDKRKNLIDSLVNGRKKYTYSQAFEEVIRWAENSDYIEGGI